MTPAIDRIHENANTIFRQMADLIEHLLGQALQLDAADPQHVDIALKMANAVSHIFTVYALQVTSVPPIVLSAAAELHEHINSSSRSVVTTPSWTKIRPNDPRSRHSPLYPLSIGYGEPRQPSPPAAGPSQPNAVHSRDTDVPAGKGKGKETAQPEGEEDRGRGRERKRPRPRAMSISSKSQSRPPKAKRQRQRPLSKAVISSEDEEELDATPVPQMTPVPINMVYKPGQLTSRRERRLSAAKLVVASDNESDAEETPKEIGPTPKSGTAYVEVPPAPKPAKAPTTSAVVLAEDDHANKRSPVWDPGCGTCVQRDFTYMPAKATIPRVESWLSKQKCGGKGSAAPNKGKKSTIQMYLQKIWTLPCRPQPQEHLYLAPVPPSTGTTILIAKSSTTATATDTSADTQESVLALKKELDLLKAMVAGLVEKVGSGEKLLQHSNDRLAEQEAHLNLLAEQLDDLRRELRPPTLPSPAEVSLPGNTVNGEQEEPAESVSVTAAPGEEEEPAETVSVTSPTGEQEQSAESGSLTSVPMSVGEQEESADVTSATPE
ncbi:hypothetical protein DFJ58DRAFT_837309 [Suillus subalutaceus]|uniref:uncharacterized protein n=1 Tax=Suillus subalutaceus TaxID=48586 RepID=UPI001B86CE3D|nr:uncharacterized protein DFJ58DRAFT_837309 [Suillus subalutaceus]KAG1871358.1 hypothetical protein DFJ58DRAFT_837309 [Suillus subalutaceus]